MGRSSLSRKQPRVLRRNGWTRSRASFRSSRRRKRERGRRQRRKQEESEEEEEGGMVDGGTGGGGGGWPGARPWQALRPMAGREGGLMEEWTPSSASMSA